MEPVSFALLPHSSKHNSPTALFYSSLARSAMLCLLCACAAMNPGAKKGWKCAYGPRGISLRLDLIVH